VVAKYINEYMKKDIDEINKYYTEYVYTVGP